MHSDQFNLEKINLFESNSDVCLASEKLLRHLLELFSNDAHLCTCSSDNRNSNAFVNEQETTMTPADYRQLYPQMRKFYNCETNLLEHVHITMSTVKPEQIQEETSRERRCRRTRISKQRAKLLITGYCTKKVTDSARVTANKRNHSSFCFFFVFHLLSFALDRTKQQTDSMINDFLLY